jgi:hypothetical protein
MHVSTSAKFILVCISGEVLPIGNIKINSLSELRRLAGVKNQGDTDYPTLLDIEVCSRPEGSNSANQKPNFGTKCKIFELDSCQGIGKVSWQHLKNNKLTCNSNQDPDLKIPEKEADTGN